MGVGLCIYSREEKHKRNMDKYKVAIVDDDEVALGNRVFELGKGMQRFFFERNLDP